MSLQHRLGAQPSTTAATKARTAGCSCAPRRTTASTRRIREVAAGVAAAHGASAEVTYSREFAPTVHDAYAAAHAGRAATVLLGGDRVDLAAPPVMASEDLGVLARHVPACLVFLGNGVAGDVGGVPLHSGDYVFDDGVLASGVAFLAAVVTG